jgi:hypothetical protein
VNTEEKRLLIVTLKYKYLNLLEFFLFRHFHLACCKDSVHIHSTVFVEYFLCAKALLGSDFTADDKYKILPLLTFYQNLFLYFCPLLTGIILIAANLIG